MPLVMSIFLGKINMFLDGTEKHNIMYVTNTLSSIASFHAKATLPVKLCFPSQCRWRYSLNVTGQHYEYCVCERKVRSEGFTKRKKSWLFYFFVVMGLIVNSSRIP